MGCPHFGGKWICTVEYTLCRLKCPLYMRQLRGLNKRGLTLLDGVGTGGDIPKLPTAVETFLLKSNPVKC